VVDRGIHLMLEVVVLAGIELLSVHLEEIRLQNPY
jgi:hypothetical protein